MSISAPFIRRPIATSLLMAGIFLIGAAAYPFLPVAALPDVEFPTIQITTQLPGADPVTMATSVTAPLERQFAQIPGVTQMTSSSVLGVSSITVQFDLGRNIDGAAGDVQSAINAAGGQLPKNLPSPPSYRKVNPADPPIMARGAGLPRMCGPGARRHHHSGGQDHRRRALGAGLHRPRRGRGQPR